MIETFYDSYWSNLEPNKLFTISPKVEIFYPKNLNATFIKHQQREWSIIGINNVINQVENGKTFICLHNQSNSVSVGHPHVSHG